MTASNQSREIIISMTNDHDLTGMPSALRHVYVFIEFVRFGEIDNINEKFQAEIHIQSRWVDKELVGAFDPKIHWIPKLYVENAFFEIDEKTSYFVNKVNDYSIVTEHRVVKGYFWERLEIENFPLDIQELSVIVTTKWSPNQVKLLADPQRLSSIRFEALNTFMDQQKWKLFKMVKLSETPSYDKENSNLLRDTSPDFIELINAKRALNPSKIAATCYVCRKPGYYIFNAFYLIFMITVTGLTIFSFDCKGPAGRISSAFLLLLSSVTFKWVVNRSLPTVSYLTSLDKYSIVHVTYLGLMCVWFAIVGAYWEKPFAQEIDKWFLIAFSIILFIIEVVFIAYFYIAHSKIKKLRVKENEFLSKFKRALNQDFSNKQIYIV